MPGITALKPQSPSLPHTRIKRAVKMDSRHVRHAAITPLRTLRPAEATAAPRLPTATPATPRLARQDGRYAKITAHG
jgi:hypothetical protein